MDLHSGLSLWSALNHRVSEYPTRDADRSYDVAIIGGGISGALAAVALVKEGFHSVLLDKAQPATGSTAASTGLLLYEVDTPLVDLIDYVGAENAVRAYQLGLWAIDEIERLLGEIGIDCGFSRRQSLYLASSEKDTASLQQEFECRRKYGFDVRFLDDRHLADLVSFPAPAAILSTGDAQIDPLRFTRGLIDRAARDGLSILPNTQATAINYRPKEAVLTTNRGDVAARRIVFATGYDSFHYLRQPLAKLHSTYVLATDPLGTIDGWPDGWLMWETARPYFYLRSTDDGRVVMGGEDTPYADDHERDSLVERQADRLQVRFHTMFPSSNPKPTFAWAGTFAETKDGLAYVGQTPEYPLAYFALGYGGNGITFSVIAARIIADLMAGRRNADAQIFRFGR